MSYLKKADEYINLKMITKIKTEKTKIKLFVQEHELPIIIEFGEYDEKLVIENLLDESERKKIFTLEELKKALKTEKSLYR